MNKVKKNVILIMLGVLEVVFLAWILASNVPRRSADLAAFSQYQSMPTSENKELWLKERRVTQNEVQLRRYTGTFLAIGNLLLFIWVARRQTNLSARSVVKEH